MIEIIRNNEKKVQFIFKLSYLLLVISTFNSFLYTSFLQSYFVKLCLGMAIFALFLRMFVIKNYLKTLGWRFLLLFGISYLISSVINFEYGFFENIKWLIWMALAFVLLYMYDIKCDTSYYKKEFKIIGHILLSYSLCASVISLGMMLTRYARLLHLVDGEKVKAGYFWGRLWGIYTDPNYGATFSVAMLLLALYFWKTTTKKIPKIFYCLTVLLDFLYIIYSDSRTAKVAMCIGLGFLIFSTLWHHWRKDGVGKRIAISLIGTILILILTTGTMEGLKNVYLDKIGPYIESHFESIDPDMSDVTSMEIAKEREEDIKKDISNRRFDLWKSGFEVWKTTPLFGTGYVTFDEYAIDRVPDTYAVNNDYGVFANTHNQYINILVFQGGVGLIILVLFMRKAICRIWLCLWKCEGEEFYYIVTMVSIIAVVAVTMMFLLEGIYTNSLGVFLLWFMLGVCLQFADRKEIENKKTKCLE